MPNPGEYVQEVIDFCGFSPVFWSLDWKVVEQALGHRLPSDYMRLCDAIPPGKFSGFFWLLHPLGSRGGSLVSAEKDLRDVLRELTEIYRDEEEWNEEEWIDPGTLFPCFQTDNGDVGYWASTDSEDPDKWTVVINWAGGLDWDVTELTLSALLHRHIIEGSDYLFSSALGDNWVASFTSYF